MGIHFVAMQCIISAYNWMYARDEFNKMCNPDHIYVMIIEINSSALCVRIKRHEPEIVVRRKCPVIKIATRIITNPHVPLVSTPTR